MAIGANECGAISGKGQASNDHVYEFSPTVAGVYTVILDPTFDAALYIATDCATAGATCLDYSDGYGDEVLTLSVPDTSCGGATCLSVSYEIVRNHGGEIRVFSELGAGTVFEVRLPAGESVHEGPLRYTG